MRGVEKRGCGWAMFLGGLYLIRGQIMLKIGKEFHFYDRMVDKIIRVH